MSIEFKAIIFVHCGVNGTVQNIYFQWWIYSRMHIGALGVHPTFYPAVQKLKAALYLLNQYVYYNSLTYLYKIVTKTLIGASLTACCYTARFTRGARHGGNLVHSTKKSEEINRNEIRKQEITRKNQ